MSLLLTKSCEYAILIKIQQGKNFQRNSEIQVKSTLDLQFSACYGLIPPNSTIQSPIVQIDRKGEFTADTSLVYYISAHQLQRLRKLNSSIEFSICQTDKTDKLVISLSNIKDIVCDRSIDRAEQINHFVKNNGDWYRVHNRKIKIGLYAVPMPKTKEDAAVVHKPTSSNMHVRSPPRTPPKPTKLPPIDRKKSTPLIDMNVVHVRSPPRTPPKSTRSPTIERKKSASLVDLNVAEVSKLLKKLKVFSAPPPVQLAKVF